MRQAGRVPSLDKEGSIGAGADVGGGSICRPRSTAHQPPPAVAVGPAFPSSTEEGNLFQESSLN